MVATPTDHPRVRLLWLPSEDWQWIDGSVLNPWRDIPTRKPLAQDFTYVA
ncbi:hypothetical protein K788_0009100 (plasmid) [Paraburkholderia caribensis MBA4]|uniref:Uncharacterized protein n=1 Tax=Paraburkholderia caribensis MBA4 TaxID=1323664 RepID=A0A0P0RMN9_9BURK|nr:hypothetical protein K788_0009100 [Paraburkholderia caribensis MBA4]